MFDAAASLFTTKAGIRVTNTKTLVGVESKSFSASSSIVTTGKVEAVIDGSQFFDYNGQNETTFDAKNPVKIESSLSSVAVQNASVDMTAEGIPLEISVSHNTDLSTGQTAGTTGISSGVSTKNASAGVYVNATTTNSNGQNSTSIAAGGQAGVSAPTGGSTTSLNVYLEVEKLLNNEK